MKKATFICLGLLAGLQSLAQRYTLRSPDNRLQAGIEAGARLSYRLSYDGKTYLLPSAIGMALSNGAVLGESTRVSGSQTRSADRIIWPLYGISAAVTEKYNELVLTCAGGYEVVFRAYNEGFAYRFRTGFKDSLNVLSETAEFKLAANDTAYFHPALSEADYRVRPLGQQSGPNYTSMPLLLRADGMNLMIHESDVLDFPCMSLSAVAGNGLEGHHAAVPRTVVPGGHANFNLLVKSTQPYIARTAGTRDYPWRLVAFEKNDKDLLTNQLVYLLAGESVLNDVSWIRPGKVAWDWWNALNLSGVPFKTGFNTETYKYFIDFAARNHLEYVNLDEGWSDQFDLLKITDQLDMPELIRYAKEKHVGLILWCVWYTLDRQMMAALNQFEKWGISGVKVDFMDRDDQTVVNFQERLLKEAAKRHLLVDFHGAYHPTGMARTYPNLINTEGVKGLEWNKFDSLGTSPQHDVEIPYIRMFAGGMDYTPGAMQNYNQADWKAVFDRPMSQGTRCHQLAMYVVYYGPLQMLADAPTAYEQEPAYLKFLAAIPTTWDETVPLNGQVGESIAIARKKGDDWFIGAMTNWEPRTLAITCDFLDAGKVYEAELFQDGPNADRVGNDYQHVIKNVRKGDRLSAPMRAGGGWAAICKPIEK
ncbi:glycoside hydrolase family 97 protein [Mucilaginibacter sp. UR6-11]|uniref:glycoside hydrolase family 97 protein n=1 Tax=Mucilaginibacter sp. UR6-11 TaxID=1435644 RepID=UPI001E31C881|nr:glycoside hydrolase family 97 protein [Mucilaginibacter sp. UR6-11]MCC8423606.1 glycoside hydrolase family 97 protein [Mucilaginibacter sp. UR6-11]